MSVRFITKNHKKIPIKKMSDVQLEKIASEGNAKLKEIERKHGETFILKNKKLDALAERVAQARIEQRDRGLKKLREDNERDQKEFAKNNPEVAVLKELTEDPNFHQSDDHTWGWKNIKIDLPTYIPAIELPVDKDDPFEFNATRFKGQGSVDASSFVNNERLKEIRIHAFKDKLVSRRNSPEGFNKEAKIFVSPSPDRPIVFQFKSRTYILAPQIRS